MGPDFDNIIHREKRRQIGNENRNLGDVVTMDTILSFLQANNVKSDANHEAQLLANRATQESFEKKATEFHAAIKEVDTRAQHASGQLRESIEASRADFATVTQQADERIRVIEQTVLELSASYSTARRTPPSQPAAAVQTAGSYYTRSVDINVLVISCAAMVSRAAVTEGIRLYFEKLDIKMDSFVIQGTPPVGKNHHLHFNGLPMFAEKIIAKILKKQFNEELLETESKGWERFFATLVDNTKSPLYLAPDKNGKQMQLERSTRAVQKIIKDLIGGNPTHIKAQKDTGIVSSGLDPIVRVDLHGPDEPPTLLWNKPTLLDLRLDGEEITRIFRSGLSRRSTANWEPL